MNRQDTLVAYAAMFSGFSPEALADLDRLCAPEIVFRDPFHALTGLEAMRRVFQGMFVLFEAPSFAVHDLGLGSDHGFILWSFEGSVRTGRTLRFDGTTTLAFDGLGRVSRHIDHWDAASAVHARMPLLGSAIRLVNARIAAATRSALR
jgi:steroid delta-isomerase